MSFFKARASASLVPNTTMSKLTPAIQWKLVREPSI